MIIYSFLCVSMVYAHHIKKCLWRLVEDLSCPVPGVTEYFGFLM